MAMCMALEFYHSRQSGLGCATPAQSRGSRSLPTAPAHARIGTCAWMPNALRSPIRRSPPTVTVRDDVGIEPSPPPIGTRSPVERRSSLMRSCARCTRQAVRPVQPAGHPAISAPGAPTRSLGRCRLPPRRTPMASTSSIGRGPTRTAGTADATIRSSWRRFHSRRRRDVGCSRPTTSCVPPYPAALARLQPRHRDGDSAYSSLHVLFPTEAEARAFESAGMIVRNGLQFRWENPGFRDFADFLATFNHDKRKKVKQERRKVAAAGVTFTRKVGGEITSADWSFFHRCYCAPIATTIRRRTSTWNSSGARRHSPRT